jgi:hypothetical protein
VTAVPASRAQRTRQRAKIEAELFALLRGFREELAAVQVLDAACGAPRGALWIMPEPTHRERRIA